MSTQSLNALSSRAIIGRYYQTLEGLAVPGWVDALSTEFPSNQDTETYKMLLQSPVFRKWESGRQHKGLAVEGFTIPNEHFEATLDVDVSDLRRDKTGQIMVRVDDLARRTVNHWAKMVSERILNGHTSKTTYGATSSADGQDFFDDDHSVGASGTQQNDIDVADVPALDITLAAPTAAEMAAAIHGVIAYMHAYLDDRGEPMNEDSRNFICMTGLPLFYGAIEQACSLMSTGGGTTVNNPLFGGSFKVQPVYNARLASATTQMWLFRTDVPVKPFLRQTETPPTMKHIGAGSQLEFDNDLWSWGVDSWRGCGYGAWQYACRCTLS